jgi:hypothetical protein
MVRFEVSFHYFLRTRRVTIVPGGPEITHGSPPTTGSDDVSVCVVPPSFHDIFTLCTWKMRAPPSRSTARVIPVLMSSIGVGTESASLRLILTSRTLRPPTDDSGVLKICLARARTRRQPESVQSMNNSRTKVSWRHSQCGCNVPCLEHIREPK